MRESVQDDEEPGAYFGPRKGTLDNGWYLEGERAASPASPASLPFHKNRKLAHFELQDVETNDPAYRSANPKSYALIKEALMLTDSEVTISFMKFMVGVAILNFPAQSAHLGVFNGLISTIVIALLIMKTNENYIKAMPLDLMNQNLTMGELSSAVFGHRSYKHVVDILVLLCQGSNYILYLKYVGVQVN